MTYKLSVLNNRVRHLFDELGDNITIVKTDDDTNNDSGQFTRVEITINDNIDLLKLFHAGIRAGEANE